MKTCVFVTGVGNIGFAATLLSTIGRDRTGDYAPLYYMEDVVSGCDFRGFEYLFEGRFDGIIKHTRRGGCNALWNEAVRWAHDNDFQCCIVLNDDIQTPTNGLVDQMVRVLEGNSHVGMVGVGSDGAWEQEHRHRERWFTDPSLLLEAAEHYKTFRDRPVKYVHHVAGPCWGCKPKLWLDAGGIPEAYFWGFGEVIPCIELRKMGYQSAAVQFPASILHFGGGAFYDLHSDRDRDASFARRSSEHGNEGEMFAVKYGTGHIHLLAQEFDEKLPSMNLPPIQYEPSGG